MRLFVLLLACVCAASAESVNSGRVLDSQGNAVAGAMVRVKPASNAARQTASGCDDHVPQQLDAGIDAGQHECGGISLEIRRFGFNRDHGCVHAGLKAKGANQALAVQRFPNWDT